MNDERVEPLRLLVARRGEFLAFLQRRPVPGAEPEDLLQQGFLRATSRIEQLREPSLAVPWFYRVLRRVLADQVQAGRESVAEADQLPSALQYLARAILFDSSCSGTRL